MVGQNLDSGVWLLLPLRGVLVWGNLSIMLGLGYKDTKQRKAYVRCFCRSECIVVGSVARLLSTENMAHSLPMVFCVW